MALSRVVPSLLIALVLGGPAVLARDLTFDERVQAQAAIERVRYSHQIGASRPFKAVFTRAVLERSVRLYLKQSVALEAVWGTELTAEALERELARMARG